MVRNHRLVRHYLVLYKRCKTKELFCKIESSQPLKMEKYAKNRRSQVLKGLRTAALIGARFGKIAF